MALHNLVSIHSARNEMRTLPHTVELILKDMAIESVNTEKNYRSFYKEFFRYTLNKELEDVSWEDVLSISYDDVVEYKKALLEKNSAQTVSTKIASIQSLYKELHKVNREIDVVVVSVKVSKSSKIHKNSWGSLTEREVDDLLEHCMTYKDKPLERKMFFETAFVTAIRKSALLSLTWDDIKHVRQQDGLYIWVIEIMDKTGISRKPISDAMYERLLKLKDLRSARRGNNVFNVSDKTLKRTLDDYCEKYDIDPERKIVIHSLKKASMDKVFIATGDITATAQHGSHSGIEMAYRNYLNKNNDMANKPSYTLFEEKLDMSILDTLSKEELISIISGCSDTVIHAILNKAKEKNQ